MLLPLLGSAGMGLVWGWLLVQRQSQPPVLRRRGRLLALSAATVLAAVLVALLAGRTALVGFLVATGIAVIAHLAWLQTLRRQAPPSR